MYRDQDEDFWVINKRIEVGREEVLLWNIFCESFGRDWGILGYCEDEKSEVLEEFEKSWNNIHSLLLHHCSFLWHLGIEGPRVHVDGSWGQGVGQIPSFLGGKIVVPLWEMNMEET